MIDHERNSVIAYEMNSVSEYARNKRGLLNMKGVGFFILWKE